MTSFRYHPDPEEGLQDNVLQSIVHARRVDRKAALYASDGVVRWLLYSILFAFMPFAIHAAILWLDNDAGTQVTLRNVFQLPTLIFLGVVVCGTMLEKLVVTSRGDLSWGHVFRVVGTFLYTSLGLVLAAAYALSVPPGTLTGNPPVGEGGQFGKLILVPAMTLLSLVVLLSALALWLLHYNTARRSSEGAFAHVKP